MEASSALQLQNIFANLEASLSFAILTHPLVRASISRMPFLGGVIFYMFGHFMSESLQRLWYREDNCKYLFLVYPNRVGKYPDSFADLADYQQDVFLYLGFSADQIELVSEEITCKSLLVPSQGSILGNNYSVDPRYFTYLHDIYDRFSTRIKTHPLPLPPGPWRDAPHKKIFVSRSHLKGASSFAGQAYLDEIMIQNGYHIMRPDHMSIEQKLWELQHAEKLVFIEGSAIHNLELLPSISSKVCVIARRKRAGIYNTTFMLKLRATCICYFDEVINLSPLLCSYYEGLSQPVPSSALCLLSIKKLVRFLSDNDFIGPSTEIDESAFYNSEAIDILSYLLHSPLASTTPEDFSRQFKIFRSEVGALTQNPLIRK